MLALLLGGPLLQGLPQLLETLSGGQYSFQYGPGFTFEHKTKQGGVRYFVGPAFDASTFLDDSRRQVFEKDIVRKWVGHLDEKCKFERQQRDRFVVDSSGNYKRADTPTPSCVELTRLSPLRR